MYDDDDDDDVNGDIVGLIGILQKKRKERKGNNLSHYYNCIQPDITNQLFD